MAVCNRLKVFWDKARTIIKWKIRVFDSILKSKILYGLESIEFITSNKYEINKINAFQMQDLRRIPHSLTIYSYTNRNIFEILKNNFDSEVELFSDTWLKRKMNCFYYILKINPNGPLRQMLFEYNSHIPHIEYRRPGKSRISWLLHSFKDIFGMLGHKEKYNYNNREYSIGTISLPDNQPPNFVIEC